MIRRVTKRIEQIRCGLGGGHLWVTHYRPTSVRTICYLCEAERGSGWQTKGLKKPKPCPIEKKTIRAWPVSGPSRRLDLPRRAVGEK